MALDIFKNIKPEEIVLVSFTNASVDDIKNLLRVSRVENLYMRHFGI